LFLTAASPLRRVYYPGSMKYFSILFLLLTVSLSIPAQQKLREGDAAPDFLVGTLDGTQLSSSQLRGKVVLLTFWATYCPICQAELPKLNTIAESYRGKEIVFIGITTERAPAIASYLKNNPRSFAIVPDGFGLIMQYGDKDKDGRMNVGYPNYYLIDQRGKIAMRASGFDKTVELNDKIASLLTPAAESAPKP
jgi:peroxiredoxin